jgi:SAM-dependent methyltransferase
MTSGDAREHWEQQADAWIALTQHDPDYDLFNKPTFLDLVPPPGRLTVDVGGGEGRLARELIALGHSVIVVDGSPPLVAAARAGTPPAPGAVADVTRLPVASGAADIAVCFMVLIDVDDLDQTVSELARVLAPGGVLCTAMLHPIFTSGLFIDGYSNQTFYMGEYSRSMRHLIDVRRPTGEQFSFRIEHRPIERYSRAFEAAGLALTHIREPRPPDDALAVRAELARFRRVPEFLHLRAQRLHEPG